MFISNIMYFCIYVVKCSAFSMIEDGVVVCSLGDDGVSSYEDTCNFTCNSGYTLTGSDTKICLNDGSWSGTESSCERGTKITKLM